MRVSKRYPRISNAIIPAIIYQAELFISLWNEFEGNSSKLSEKTLK
jgi:hypothetical protein